QSLKSAGILQNQCLDKLRMSLRDIEADRSTSGMAQQVNLTKIHSLNELWHIINVLFDREIIACSIPFFWAVMPQTYGDDSIFSCEYRKLSGPRAVITHRSVHQYEWNPGAHLLVRHIVTVDLNGFDAVRKRPFR